MRISCAVCFGRGLCDGLFGAGWQAYLEHVVRGPPRGHDLYLELTVFGVIELEGVDDAAVKHALHVPLWHTLTEPARETTPIHNAVRSPATITILLNAPQK